MITKDRDLPIRRQYELLSLNRSRLLYYRHRSVPKGDLRLMGISAIYPKILTSKLGKEHKICPYLLRNLDINRSNQVWAAGISDIPMLKGFVYLAAIVDSYSSKVFSWGCRKP